jgi:magnesium-transporting ATPase (P-type)
VQKRLHRPGWHVSWNKNYKQNKGSEALEEKSIITELTQEEELPSFEFESNIREDENKNEQFESTSSSEYADQYENEIATDTVHTRSEWDAYISRKSSEEKNASKKGHFSPLFFISIFFATIGTILLIYALLNFTTFFYQGVLTLSATLIFLGVLLLLTAFILFAISLFQR